MLGEQAHKPIQKAFANSTTKPKHQSSDHRQIIAKCENVKNMKQ
jgi:hypothetical protein